MTITDQNFFNQGIQCLQFGQGGMSDILDTKTSSNHIIILRFER